MSATAVMLDQNGSYLNKSDGSSLLRSGRNDPSVEDVTQVSTSERINDDSISFLGLPYQIWKKIFRYAGVICPCHIELFPVTHGALGSFKRGSRQKSSQALKTRPGLVTCIFRKRPEPDDDCRRDHKTHFSVLGVSKMARFITLKALLQEGTFHLNLRNTTDVDGLEHTLRGFDDMQPMNGYLKSLHVKLSFSRGQQKSHYLGVWYYFCDYFGKHLKGNLIRFGLECFPRTVENAEEIMASKAIRNLRGPRTCYVVFNFALVDFNQHMPPRYEQLSERFVRGVMAFEQTGTFRFMELPTEIQMIILRYALTTDEVLIRGKCSWVYCVPVERLDDVNEHNHSCFLSSYLKHAKNFCAFYACSCLLPLSVTMGQFLKPGSIMGMSPMPVFRTNKHIYALGGLIFYSQNKFKFDTKELFKLCNYQRPYVCLGFPKRHIGRVRHLHIKLVARSWEHYRDCDVKEFKRLAELLKEAFEHASIDLEVDEESWGPVDREKVLSLLQPLRRRET